MGRPINKRNLGNAIGSIRVTNYRMAAGVEEAGGFIVRQRSTNRFEVTSNDLLETEVLELVDVNAGSLAVGTFRISGISDASAVVNVTKLRNRTVQFSDGTNQAYVLGPIDQDAVSSDALLSVDRLTAAIT